MRAVLDGRNYEQRKLEARYYSDRSSKKSENSCGDVLMERSYLSSYLFEPVLNGNFDETEMDPASVEHCVSYDKESRYAELASPREKVTLLNGSSRSFNTLAAAFITVSYPPLPRG